MHLNHGLVSILIPTYNREQYIEECINSAINQSYQNIEIIIVDNNSSDRTANIIEKLAARDSRISFYINSENVGPVENWKKCLTYAKGEFIKFLFSDDLLAPNCIQSSLDKLLQHDACGVVSDIWICDNFGHKLKTLNYSKYFSNHKSQFERYLMSVGMPVSPGCALFSTKIFENRSIFEECSNFTSENPFQHGVGPDLKMFLAAASLGPIVQLEKPVNIFREHEQSISTLTKKNRLIMLYNIARLDFLKSNGDEKMYQTTLGRVYFDYLIYGSSDISNFSIELTELFNLRVISGFLRRFSSILLSRIRTS